MESCYIYNIVNQHQIENYTIFLIAFYVVQKWWQMQK